MSSVATAALTIDDIAAMFSSYLILSIEPTGGDSTIYEVVYEDDGVAYVAYVDSDSGDMSRPMRSGEAGKSRKK